jgi:hypothetical protein
MAVNGTHAIIRYTSGGQTETTILTDKIEFDDDNLVPDARSHIKSIRPIMSVINTDNANPGSLDSPNSQDTGRAPTFVEIKGYFDEKDGTAAGIESLKDWMNEPNVIKTLYPKGRFGFRSNDRSEWNMVPTADGGYQITHFEIEDIVEFNNPQFIIRLKYVGDKDNFS